MIKKVAFLFFIWTFSLGMVHSQTNLISWKKLDTNIFFPFPSDNFKRIQIGDKVDHLGFSIGFTDSSSSTKPNKDILYKYGDQEILSINLEASTWITKKTLQDVILIRLDTTLEKEKSYFMEMKYAWCGVNYNSNNLFVSFLSKSDLEEIVKRDFKNLSDYYTWLRTEKSNFSKDEFKISSFTYNAKGQEKYVMIGSPRVKKLIPKKHKNKRAFDYWGLKINALRLCFSDIYLYPINTIDSFIYQYPIGQDKVERILDFKKFDSIAVIDSMVIQGFADTTGLGDSLNLSLAKRRSEFLKLKYHKDFPEIPIYNKEPNVLPGIENRKTVVKIYRRLTI